MATGTGRPDYDFVSFAASAERGRSPTIELARRRSALSFKAALAWGLLRTSGTSASLMLTLEALFTAVLAWRLYRATMDRRCAKSSRTLRWALKIYLFSGSKRAPRAMDEAMHATRERRRSP